MSKCQPDGHALILETFSTILLIKWSKLAVLADMKELGEQSVDLHKANDSQPLADVLDTVYFLHDIAGLV